MTLRELEALHSNGPISQMIEKKLSKAIESIAYVSQSLENFRENQWEKISHFTKFPTFLHNAQCPKPLFSEDIHEKIAFAWTCGSNFSKKWEIFYWECAKLAN